MSECPHCRGFRERAEQLEESLRQAQAALRDGERVVPADWRLTRSQSIIAGLLVTRELVTRDTFAEAMLARDPHWQADDKIFDVHICNLRRRLGPFGVAIETVWGRGYRLPVSQRTAIRGGAQRVGPPVPWPEGESRSLVSRAIVAALADGSARTCRELADALSQGGLPAQIDTVRYHLNRLTDDGVLRTTSPRQAMTLRSTRFQLAEAHGE